MLRFFTTNGDRINEIAGAKMPKDWWSRPYEYAWTLNFVNDGEKVIESGYAHSEPFRKHIEGKVVLMDIDKAEDNSVDKIFCISYFEHSKEKQALLTRFERALKPGGNIIMTIDYPTLKPEELKFMVDKTKLKFTGEVESSVPDNAICGPHSGLRCYGVVLEKEREDSFVKYDTKIISPKERKPIKPRKRKG